MADLKDKASVGGAFSNAKDIVRVVYDFAEDAGAIGDLEAIQSSGDCVVMLEYAIVKTACTSGGSMTLDLGKNGGAEFLSGVAVAALTLDSMHLPSAPAAVELADGESVDMGIATAALTAGKIEFVFGIYRK